MATDVKDPVRALQELSRDITKRSFEVENKRYWCTSASRLDMIYFQPERSALVKKGVLKKLVIGYTYPLRDKLPQEVYLGKSVIHLYIIQDGERLQKFIKSRKSAADFLDIKKPTVVPVDYKRAVEFLQKEIAEHPDPGMFLVKVIKDLLPTSLSKR